MPKLGIIFDVDGVLIDSYQAHFESWRRLYGEIGCDYTEAAFAADFGRTSRDILRRTLGNGLSDEQVRELDGKKEAYFRAIIAHDLPAMDGASELLGALAADEFQLAIGSSGPPENVAIVLEQLPGGAHIEAAVTGADVTRGKPDPQVFQIAAERLGIPPDCCAVVEDALHGIEAAQRAGMTAIALVGTMPRDCFTMADLVVDSLRELSPGCVRDLIASSQRSHEIR
jgi:beta-phosphoglucomutase